MMVRRSNDSNAMLPSSAARQEGSLMHNRRSELCFSRRVWAGLYTVLATLATNCIAAGQDARPPKLHTKEAYVEGGTRAPALAADDPMAVFAFVLNSLPDPGKVYPTPNQYYITFIYP